MKSMFVLYRPSTITYGELNALNSAGIPCGMDLPHDLPKGTTIFTRFRSLPYGQLLQEEATQLGYKLVNSWDQYNYIANVTAWAEDLKTLTPDVYSEADIPNLPEGEWFVKGEVNSDKENWTSACYAPNLDALQKVVTKLHNHPVVGQQNLVIRPFIHYRSLGVLENGQPICNEWRVFVLNGSVVGLGFYWANQISKVSVPRSPVENSRFQATLQQAIKNVGEKANYVVFDLAERVDGSWDVIELNDANMSGLATTNPYKLWENISKQYS